MDTPQPTPMHLNVTLPTDAEVGVFADLANVWHTPNTFVIDFLSVKQPAQSVQHDDGTTAARIDATIATRVRIPPEQVFGLIRALNEQGQRWLAENGRSEPPESWLPHP